MKILLTGCSGQVGYELQRSLQALGEVVAGVHAAYWKARCPILVNSIGFDDNRRNQAVSVPFHFS